MELMNKKYLFEKKRNDKKELTDLFESDDVGMPKRPVVNDFPLHIFIYLLHSK
jgi:hypothetical protein